MSENILEIKNLSKYFGGLAAVSDCSIKVKKGTITGIIGPNGSGKTTLFNLIAGNLKSSAGNVLFNNENITDVPSYELFSKGLLRTFQIAHEFIISGPLPYPPVILLPSKKAMINYLLILNLYPNNSL